MDHSPSIHRVRYYETDKMGIVHHSNYIRWFEEARDEFVAKNGISYPSIESKGILMPVIRVECTYKTPAKYGETVEIITRLKKFNGVRVVYDYEVRKPDGTLAATGQSEHCFISEESRKPLNVKHVLKEDSEILLRLLEEEKKGETP